MKLTRYVVSTAAALLLCNLASAAGNESTVNLDIKTQPMIEALNQFAQQTGLQLIFPAEEITAKVIAPSLVGQYTPKAALNQLLANSGLVYSYVNERTVAIRASKGVTATVEKTSTTGMTGDSHSALHLARVDAAQPAEEQRQAESTKKDEPAKDETEMVVTGSHIRGVRNDTTPVITFDREYIERSGFANTMQLVESLPQNFKGGNSGASEEAVFGTAADVGQNLSRGTGLNLRGLGAVATLTLINGRRVAPSAHGQFVDVSSIPITAIERVEVLTDGASAVYGTDAVAGVVNIILRKDFSGMETTAYYGSSTQGGGDERRLSQTFGTSWSGGNALIMGEYNHRHELNTDDRDFIVKAGAPGPNDLLPDRKLYSVIANVDQKLPGKFDLTSNLIFSHEAVHSSASGVGALAGSLIDTATNSWSAVVGLGYEPFSDWRFSLDGSIGRSLPTTVASDISEGGTPLPFWKDFIKNFSTWETDLKADGTLFRLPAGAVRIAAGLSYRNDNFFSSRRSIRYSTNPPTVTYLVRFKDERSVKAGFAEVFVPLIGKEQNVPWAQRLELSLAGRYDDYSDFGDTTNPKYGLVWSPVEALDLRVAYSTSFRAPSEYDKYLGNSDQYILSDYFFDLNGEPNVPFLVLSGSAPLQPEKSKNLSYGFTYRPEFAPGLELTVNYFDIDYRNRISTPPYDYGLLARLSDFGSLVTQFPNGAAAQAYLDQRLAQGDLYFDFTGLGNDVSSVQYLFDWRQQNSAREQINGIDLTLNYAFSMNADAFDVNLNVAHINKLVTSLTANSTQFSDLDHWQRPLDWRVRAMGSWTRGGLTSTLTLNYSDGYVNDSLLTAEPIGSWTTMDLVFGYDLGRGTAVEFFRDSKLGLSITNLFNQDPPFATDLLSSMGFDVANANAMGRFIGFNYSKRW